MREFETHGRAAPSRRRLLVACSAVPALLAGCLGRSDDGTGSDDDGTGSDDDGGSAGDGGEPGGGPGDVTDTDVVQYGPPGAPGPWPDDATGSTGVAVLIDDRDRATAVLAPGESSGDRRESLESFAEETDFATQRLLYVGSTGPDGCHDEIAFADVERGDGRLAVSAEVVDTAGPDEGCAQVVTDTGAVLRASFDGDPADEAAVTITDGWGDSDEVVVATADQLPGRGGSGSNVRPPGDPPVTRPSLACEETDGRRHPAYYQEAPWGEPEGQADTGHEGSFELRVDALEVGHGDAVTVSLENVTDEEQYTGNRHKYNLETLTEDGWQDVRVATEDRHPAYTDEAISHAPGEGFEWTFEFTEEGLVEDHFHEELLTVCPDLEPGRYRFVFWEPAVAVAWDLPEA